MLNRFVYIKTTHKPPQTQNYMTKQGNPWKRGMLHKCMLSIGRTCNQTLLVHHDMTKNNL